MNAVNKHALSWGRAEGEDPSAPDDEPVSIFVDYNNELLPKVRHIVTDFGYFGVLHPEECELTLRPLSCKPEKLYDWQLRCREHFDEILLVDYIDYGFDWLFCLHASRRREFRRELADMGLVVPSTWTTDEWLQHRLLQWRRVFDNFSKKIVFIMVK